MKVNIKNITSFDVHRYGWGYAMNFLKDFHSPYGILLDDFIEKTHSWNLDYNIVPHKNDWIGFIHNPHNMPKWFDYHNSPQGIFKSEIFIQSLKYCKCIITLSDYLKQWIEEKITVPVVSLKHPTGLVNKEWDSYKFMKSPKLVQLGYWLRNMSTIYKLSSNWSKIWLPSNKQYAQFLFEIENRINDTRYYFDNNVQIKERLSNEEYDEILSSSIVVLNLYDSSANNAVIECIARNTPMLINKHPAVVEYLGENYPLYCDFSKIFSPDLISTSTILEAERYLKNMNKDFLNGEYFASEFYKKVSKIIS